MTTVNIARDDRDAGPATAGTTAGAAAYLWAALFGIMCITVMCISARAGLKNLYDRWMYEEEYGYGFLVAALVPVLLWGKRSEIVSSQGARWPGLLLVLFSQILLVLGVAGESFYLEQIAFVLGLFALGCLIFGAGAIRHLLPIACLLLLTVPLPYTLQAMLTIELQLVSTKLGVTIIDLVHIPVHTEGNIIDLGSYKLQVAEACSGLRYLLPFACISFLVAYLYRAPIWKRAIVVLAAVPVTVFLNSFRIAVTAVLVDQFGTKMAEGFLHEFEGWIVFLGGVVLLWLLVWALQGFRWSRIEIEPLLGGNRGLKKPSFRGLSIPLLASLAVCLATLGASISIASAYGATGQISRTAFDEFPSTIGQWHGRSSALDSATMDTLKGSDYYSADFAQAADDPKVNLFVAYYDSLAMGAAIHSPKVCLPGSGWEFATFQEKDFGGLVPGAQGTYNATVIQKGEEKVLMYYWYQQRARQTANEFAMKYYLLVDNLLQGRRDGALIRVYTPIIASAGENAEKEAASRLAAFVRDLTPELSQYVPR